METEQEKDWDTIRQSDLFDAEWYRATYAEEVADGMSPEEHYDTIGRKKGFNPSPKFNTQYYLERYPDVAAAGINPLVHYLGAGRQEGRVATKGLADILPACPDIAYYRAQNADLLQMSDEAVRQHMEQYAEATGKSICRYHRSYEFVAYWNRIIKKFGLDALEIGPFYKPSLVGDCVEYFDVMDSAALRQEAIRLGCPTERIPQKIHHVSPVGDLTTVKKKYDVVFGSHSIEHQPDLIAHLINVGNILKSGGVYALRIPDKRYCFDYYLPESNVAQVIAAHHDKRNVHLLENILENMMMTTHNDSIKHWRGEHGSYGERLAFCGQGIQKYEEAHGAYVDTHAWQFTPKSFERLLKELDELHLIDLKVVIVLHTLWGGMEFCAILTKM